MYQHQFGRPNRRALRRARAGRYVPAFPKSRHTVCPHTTDTFGYFISAGVSYHFTEEFKGWHVNAKTILSPQGIATPEFTLHHVWDF